MKKINKTLFIVFFAIVNSACTQAANLKWKNFGPEAFQTAKTENKIILLNLEANWCHWCHVMNDSTYTNPKVLAYLNEHFIMTKADQDANPELAARYKEYGWPATVFLNAKGEDIVKRAGYIAPDNFLRLLKAIVADPSPELKIIDFENIEKVSVAEDEAIERLENNYKGSLDFEVGGFTQAQKYIEYDTYEYAMFYSEDKEDKEWVATSVLNSTNLVDKAWGGVYQYSTHGDWKHLHFEKLLAIQARYLNIYTDYGLYFDSRKAKSAAEATYDYVNRFLLQKDGLYANAQDADLVPGEHAEAYFALNHEERLKLGVPKVDQNTFTNNNAKMISALLKLYGSTSDLKYLNKAETVLAILLKRKSEAGFYLHQTEQTHIYSLRDQIALLEALKDFSNYKADKTNKQAMKNLFKKVAKQFILKNGAAISFVGENGLKPKPILSENIKLARLFNWYSHFAQEKKYKTAALKMYQFLLNPKIQETYYTEPGILILAKELKSEPFHYVYLNRTEPNDFSPKGKALASFYTIFNSYTKANLPVDKADWFESFEENVLFICTSSYCSSPIFGAADLFSFHRK